MKTGRSAGLREVTNDPSTTTGASTQSAPALRRSSRMAATEVTRLPLTTSAETSTEPPWQMAATRPPAAATWATNVVTASDRLQEVGRPAPGYDDTVECGRVEIGDARVGVHRVAVLREIRGLAQPGHDHRGARFFQAQLRIPQLQVLVLLCGENDHVRAVERHESVSSVLALWNPFPPG